MSSSFVIEPAGAEELPAVFRLVFRHLPAREREIRATNALRLVQLGEIVPDGVLAARCAGRLVGGLVCLPVTGASALFWPPQALPGEFQEIVENSLVSSAQDWVRGQGAKLAQTLLSPQEHALAAPLVRNG